MFCGPGTVLRAGSIVKTRLRVVPACTHGLLLAGETTLIQVSQKFLYSWDLMLLVYGISQETKSARDRNQCVKAWM